MKMPNFRDLSWNDMGLYGLLLLYTLLIIPNNIGSGGKDIALVMLFLYFIFNRDVKWKRYLNEPVLLSLLAFTFWVILAGFFQSSLINWLYILRKWPMRGILSLIVIVEMACEGSENDRSYLMLLIVLMYFQTLIGGYFDYFNHLTFDFSQRYRSLGISFGGTARMLNWFLPLIIVHYLYSSSYFANIIYLLGLLAGIVGVILTQARGGILSLLIGLLVFLFALDCCNFKRKKILLLLITILIFISSFVYFGTLEAIVQRFQARDYVGLGGRQEVWSVTWKFITKNPVLGNPEMVFDQRMEKIISKDPGDTHNVFLQAFYDGGIPGLILYLIFYYLYSRWCIREALLSKPINFYVLSFAGSFSIVWLIHGQVAHISYYYTFLLVAFTFLAREVDTHQGPEQYT